MIEAVRIYPHIIIVVKNGETLLSEDDLRYNRINVETNNDIIVQINGIY